MLAGDEVDLVVAADGGALKAVALGFTPDVVVGDSDSLAPDATDRLRASGVEVIVHPSAKDESAHGARRTRGARPWRARAA